MDKDGDGSITEAEIGRTVVEVGTILAKQANIDMGSIDMGNIDREEYERMEQTIRKTAHDVSTPGRLRTHASKCMNEVHAWTHTPKAA